MKQLILTLLSCAIFSLSIIAQHNQGSAFLGMHSNQVSEKKAEKLGFDQANGAYVTSIIGNTTAEKEGFKPFDYIYQIGEYTFKPHDHLSTVVRNFQAGDAATVYYVRNGEKLSKEVVFGKQSDANYRHRTREEDPFLGVENNHTDLPKGMEGVRVDIVENSTAEAMGLEDDDIIMEINDNPIIDWHDMGTAIDANEVGDEIKVTYWRDNKITNVFGPIMSLAETKDGRNNGSYSYSYSYGYNNPNTTKDEKAEEEALEEEIRKEEAALMAEMEIDMEDMPEEDAKQMKDELGIDMPVIQNLSIEQLNIFPNPTMGKFSLRFTLEDEGATAIRVFDARGNIVFRNDLGSFSGDYNETFDLGQQPAGTYYVMIQQGEYSVSKKVIVTRN